MRDEVVNRAPDLEPGEVFAVPLFGHTGWTLVQVIAVRESFGRRWASLALFRPVLEAPPEPDVLAEVMGDPVASDRASPERPRDWVPMGTLPVVDLSPDLPDYATGGRIEVTERVQPPEPIDERIGRWIVQRRDDPDEVEFPHTCHAAYDLIDWNERLRPTHRVVMDGDDHALTWFLEQRPWILSLTWKHHRHEVLDLGRTSLGHLDIEVPPELTMVRLPETIGSITVRVGDTDRLPSFEHVDRGRGVRLEIVGSPLVALDGLEHVAGISVRQMGRPFDQATIDHYRFVETFRVDRPVGSLEGLAAWRRLRSLELFSAVDIDPDRFPRWTEWEHMDRIGIVEIARPTYEALRERLSDAYRLEFRSIRSPAWLAQHVDNPFRYWGDRDPAIGRRATALWKRVRKLDDAGEPREAVRSLVRSLNRMMRDVGVESAERDDAFAYACEIGERHGVEQHVVLEWFDEGRDF